MFVIMISKGEYSDRWVGVLGYTASEDRAKELVAEYVRADQLEHSIEEAKTKLRNEYFPIWDEANPYPIWKAEGKPVFDQTKHKDKEYVKEHTKLKHVYQNMESEFRTKFVNPYMIARSEALNAYVEENFTMDLCEPPKWTDAQYYYEQIEELI